MIFPTPSQCHGSPVTTFSYRDERRRSEDGDWGKGKEASKKDKGATRKMGFCVRLGLPPPISGQPTSCFSPANQSLWLCRITYQCTTSLYSSLPVPMPGLCLEYRLSTSQPGIWELSFQGSVQKSLDLSSLFDEMAQAGSWTFPVLSFVSNLYYPKHCFGAFLLSIF